MTSPASTPPPSPPTEPIAPADFVSAMNRFTSGVAIVTSRDGERPVGATVAAIAPIASDPATVMVALSSTSATAAVVRRTRMLAINVLDQDEAAIAGLFASRAADRFEGIDTVDDPLGNPVLTGCVAALSCRVVDAVPTGSHVEFRARVVSVYTGEGLPLAYYRGAFAHLTTEADRGVLDAVRGRVLAVRSDSAHVLDPDELACDLDVPRGAIIRALSAVRSEGLVDRVDGAYRVPALPDAVVDEVYQAKLAIEIGAAVELIGRVTDADVRALRALMPPIRIAACGGSAESVEDLVVALNEIGECFVRLAGSEPLVRAYRALGLPGVDRRTITEAVFANIPPVGGFDEVVDALEQRDLCAVVDALRSDRRTPSFVRRASRRRA